MIVTPAQLWPCNPSYCIAATRDALAYYEDLVRRFLVAHETAFEMTRSNLRKCA
jgi:ABC-type nitrate/sulfonate/bicarbonate transport system substrate-binding protein